VNTAATRAASLAVLLFGAFVVTAGPAAARRSPADVQPPEPTATPIYFPLAAPTGTLAGTVAYAQTTLMASSFCQNDRFLSQRQVPWAQKLDVSVCGLVYATYPGGFRIAIDGTQPIAVSGKDAASVQQGESVLVVGQYRNTDKSVESIEAAGVSPLPAPERLSAPS
jgi:hypothetical protein